MMLTLDALYITEQWSDHGDQCALERPLLSPYNLKSFRREITDYVQGDDEKEEELKSDDKDSRSQARTFSFTMCSYKVRRMKASSGGFDEINDPGKVDCDVFVILRPRYDTQPAVYHSVVKWLKERYFCRKLDKRCVYISGPQWENFSVESVLHNKLELENSTSVRVDFVTHELEEEEEVCPIAAYILIVQHVI